MVAQGPRGLLTRHLGVIDFLGVPGLALQVTRQSHG